MNRPRTGKGLTRTGCNIAFPHSHRYNTGPEVVALPGRI